MKYGFQNGCSVGLSKKGTMSGSERVYDETIKNAGEDGRVGVVVSYKIIRHSRYRFLVMFDTKSINFHNGGTHGRRHGGEDQRFLWVDRDEIVRLGANKLDW